MSLEKAMSDAASSTLEATKIGVTLAETAIKKAWSIAEAASEKKSPGEYLSPRAIDAVQGKGQ